VLRQHRVQVRLQFIYKQSRHNHNRLPKKNF
jgi:hypothetical protein